jgi:hypothetical protein
LNTQTLNEDQTLAAIEAAIQSGNALELGKLMSEEQTTVKEHVEPDADLEINNPIVGKVDGATEIVEQEGEAKELAKATKDGSSQSKKEDVNNLPEWAASLPDDIKEKVLNDFGSVLKQNQQLDHYYRSNEGRVSTLQKQKDALQRELDSRRQQSKEPPVQRQQAAPSSTKLEDDSALKELREADPALYEILKKREEQVLSSAQKLVDQAKAEFNSALESNLRPVRQKQEDDFRAEQQKAVLTYIPNAADVVSSQHWKMFENEASDGVRTLINSDRAEDVIAAFHLYNTWANLNFPEPEAHQSNSSQQIVQSNGHAAKVEEERQRKLRAGTPTSKSSVQVTNNLTDFDAALEEVFQKRWKDMGYK